MDKLWSLFKTTFADNYNLNKWTGNGKNSVLKSIGMLLLVVVILGYLMFAVGMYAFLGIDYLAKYNLQDSIITIFAILTIGSIFMMSIYKAKSTIFSSKDNDMLFSMPISPSIILANKIINLLIINYVTVLITFVPVIVVYAFKMHVSILYYIYSLIAVIFMPFIPTVLSSVIGYFIAFISSKTKRKNMAETIITFIIVFGIMYLSANIQTIAQKFVSNIAGINDILKTIGFPIYHLQKAICEGNFVSLMLYILVNVIFLAVFILVLNKSYKHISSKLQENRVGGKYKEKKLSTSSVSSALLKKELRTYFSIPVYVMNSAFGVVLLIGLAIASIFYDKTTILNALELQNMNFGMYQIFLAIITFIVAMSSTTSSSISLEGNNFWVMRSLPISEKQIFKSKILVNIIIVLPLTILSIIILGINFKITILQILMTIIYAVILNIMISQFGLITNLKFPKLKFKAPVQVVKQSLSTFVAVFAAMIMFFAIVLIYQKVSSIVDFEHYYVYVTALFIAIIVIQNILLNKWGINKFRKLQ